MAWDDTPPTAADIQPANWDETPPTQDELEPPKSLEGFLGNALSNAGRAINPVNIAEGLGSSVKEGLYDLPKAAGESSVELLKDAAKAVTGGDLPDQNAIENTPILAETRKMTEPIAKDPLGYAYKNPVDAAMLAAAPILGMTGDEEAAADVPRETAAPEAAAQAPKELPVMPGKTSGPVHALFDYNDPITGKSSYKIYGDPALTGIETTGNVPFEALQAKGIPVVGMTEKAAKLGHTPLDNITGAAPAAEGTPTGKPPMPASAMFDMGAKAAQDAANEVKNYVSTAYGNYAKKPGALADIADWVQEKSQMMAAQQLGITPAQARQLGRTPMEAHNAMRAIGQYALDKDIVSPTTGLSGMLEKNAALQKSVGNTLSGYREMADKMAGEVDPKEIAQAVRNELDKKYMRGVDPDNPSPRGAYGGQSGAYQRALQELEDAEHSHSGIADAATELNHAANKAAKNLQPETPFTDVANVASRINNERIKALIGKDNAAKYEQALREYGVNKKIANALRFKSSGEVKRFGPGSIGSNLTQKAMDELGYRFGAKAANKLSTSIKNNPSVAKSLPSLFKEFTHQVENVGDEAVGGMAKGGVVPDDVRQWVNARC